ncbi:MAG: DUF3429 family protein [Comamonadaceae bacterium]|nr:DUF3429 family protein [Comamonadaceae bacterium]
MQRRRPRPPETAPDARGAAPPSPYRPPPQQPWRFIYASVYAMLLVLLVLVFMLGTSLSADVHALTVQALQSHLAIGLAFSGGIHWGVGLRYTATTARIPVFHFIWGLLLAYLGWGVVLIAPPAISLVLLALLHLWSHLVDRRVWPGAGLGPWLHLRLHYTVAAITICLAGAGLLAMQ